MLNDVSDAAHVRPTSTSSTDLAITVFAAADNPAGQRDARTYRELIEDLRTPFPRTVEKVKVPLWSPATFVGDYRNADNVEAVHAIGFDVDVAPVPPAEALRACVEKHRGFFHSSSSALATSPRWRLVLFCSRPVTAAEYRRVWRALEREFNFSVGQEAKDASRAWFLPHQGQDSSFIFEELTGSPVDVDALLATEPPEPAPSGVVLASQYGGVSDERRSAAVQALGLNWPAKGRHVAQRALAGALCRDGWPEEDALEFLCDVCTCAGDEDRPKRTQTIRDTYRNASDGKPFTGWAALGEALPRKHAAETARTLLETFYSGPLSFSKEEPAAEAGLGFQFGAWETPPPPIEFLVDGLFPRSCVGMLYGHADSLKTWLLFSLGIAVASGTPWLGKFKTKQGRVGLVDFETGQSNTTRRLFMLGAGTNKNLGAKSFPKLKPNDPEFWAVLEHEAFDLVIIDSLRRANPGANENDSAESIVPLEHAAEFSERTGCAVVFIHHAKKSKDGWPEQRGSAAINDQVDCAYVVKKEDVSALVKRVEVRCDKPGDMTTPEPFNVEVEFNDVIQSTKVRCVQAAGPGRAEQPAKPDLAEEVLLAVRNGKHASVDALRKATGKKKPDVTAAVKGLIEARKLVKLEGFYCVDTDEKRLARIIDYVTKNPKTSETKIGGRACVENWEVQKALEAGVIKETSSGWFGVVKAGPEVPRSGTSDTD